MKERQESNDLLRVAVKDCLRRVRFARAVELAKSRRFLEAEGLLTPNGLVSSDPRELDLLARIAAKQRRFSEAQRLWEAALRLSPSNSDCQRAIVWAAAEERMQRFLRKVTLVVLAIITAAASMLMVLSLMRGCAPASEQPLSAGEHLNVAQQR